MDLTTLATPAYFGTMAIEHRVLERRAREQGPSAADYQRPDTLASLAMGTLSLFTPVVADRIFRRIGPGRGRGARRLLAATAAAAVATTIADRVVRRSAARGEAAPASPAGGPLAAVPGEARAVTVARTVSRVGGVATVAGAGLLATATSATLASPQRLWQSRRRDLGTGLAARAAAVLGWDLIYYVNHRMMHEVRAMWAHHVVHHSSERFNLSTALRQPVSPFGLGVPMGLLSWAGVRPSLVEEARGVNLLYQYWIHTDAIRRLGPAEEVLNTPSHHRAHHGSNRRYIDRNHGSILIVWDRLFGTFAREADDEPVVYGLTRNIDTFQPLRIIGHEYAAMFRDVADSSTWADRASFVLRGPGWAYRRRAEMGAPEPLVAS